jgi:hypothetical protein
MFKSISHAGNAVELRITYVMMYILVGYLCLPPTQYQIDFYVPRHSIYRGLGADLGVVLSLVRCPCNIPNRRFLNAWYVRGIRASTGKRRL